MSTIQSNQILFIDAAVRDADLLLAGIDPSIEVVRLLEGEDGLSQIARALDGRSGIDALHIMSHGRPGMLALGSAVIDSAALADHALELSTIRAALSDDADLLLYGCDVAASDAGSAFIAALADATGADVAASIDPTGSALLSGDWELEAHAGTVETASIAVQNYDDVMASGILRNAYVRFGYSDDGTLGWGGSAKPGIQYDKDGNRSFLDTADFLTPGSPFEFFSVTANGATKTNNNTNVSSPGMATTLTSTALTTVGADTYGSLTYVSWFGALKITQVYTLGATSQVISMQVTMENTGSTTISGVQYARGIDPDVDSNGLAGSTSSTNNVRGAAGMDADDIVLSTGPVSGRIIGLYSDSSFNHNTAVSPGWSTSPSAYLAGSGNSNGDSVIGMGFNLGTLVAGQSTSFSFAYVFAASAAALAASVSQVPASNAAPTLSAMAGPVDTVAEDSQVEISYAELAAQANEADDTGVTGFVVRGVTSGTLLIGSSAGTARPWTPGSNDTIPSDGSLKLYWTPAANANGVLNAVTIVARDADGATSTAPVQVQVNVTAVNDAPTLSADAALKTIDEDAAVNSGSTVTALFAPRFADVDAGQILGGVVVTGNAAIPAQGAWQYYSGGSWHDIGAVGESAGLALSASTAIRFLPAANYNGAPGALTVHATDSQYSGGYTNGADRAIVNTTTDLVTSGISDGSRNVTISVNAVNDAPVITSAAGAATLADTAAHDGAFAAQSGALSGVLTATDVESPSNLLAFSVRGGTVAGGTWTREGLYGTLSVDQASGAWTYAPNKIAAINALPQGASVVDSFDFKVQDPQGGYSTQALAVTITGSNDLPVLSSAIADQSFSGSGAWHYQLPAASFTDAEGTGLHYTATLADGSPLPGWLSFDADTRTFSGNPTAAWNDAALTIRVTATDDAGASVSDQFQLTLDHTANQPPVVSSPLQWKAVDAVNEVTDVAFTGSLGGTTLAFNGSSVTLGSAASGAEVASALKTAFDAATGADYSAGIKPGSDHVLVLTANAAGDRADFVHGATVNVAGGSYTVAVTTAGVNEVSEVVAVQFMDPPPGATEIEIGLLRIDISAAMFAQDVVAMVVSALNGDPSSPWTAAADGTEIDKIILTAKLGGARADLAEADFTVFVGGVDSGTLANTVAVTTQGVTGVAEVAELSFTGSHGGASITIDGVTAAAGSAVSANQVAAALAGDYADYTVVDAGAGHVTITAREPGNQADIGPAAFSGSYSGAAAPSVVTQGAGWRFDIPAGTFTDPEGDALTYTAYTIDPATGAATALVNSAALGFDGAALSGDGSVASSSIIEIRAQDASGGVASSQFQLVVYKDAQAESLVAGVVPASVGFVNGAGSGSYTLPATAFSYLDDSAGHLSYTAQALDAGGTPGALPGWLHFDTTSGTFSGNPPAGSDDLRVQVIASNGTLSSAPVSFILAIDNPNDGLVLSHPIADQSVATGAAVGLAFTKPFTDPDGGANGTPGTDGITYSATANGQPLANFGLTLAINETGQLTINGNPPGGTPYLNIVVTGTETSGGTTASTSFTLNLGSADVGHADSVGALAANNAGAVTVSGTPLQGQTLTAAAPTDADGVSGAVTYQWQVSGDDGATWQDIGGARGNAGTLTLAQSESGKAVRVQAFYIDGGNVAEAPVSTSLRIADLPEPGAIAVTGALAPGQTLSAALSDADGLVNAAPSYQWQISSDGSIWSNIGGATYSAYTLGNSDGGKYVRVLTSYTDDMGNVETNVTSASRGPVQLGAVAPVAGNDAGSVTEASGANNAVPGSGPAVGNLKANDSDANPGDVLTVTSLRSGNLEGFGDAASLSGSSLTVNGAYGTLVVDTVTGAYTYTLNESHESVQALSVGNTLLDSFNYTLTDSGLLSDTAVLNITINGANDLPTMGGVPSSVEVIENAPSALPLELLTLVDPDSTTFSLRLSVDAGTLRAVSADASVSVVGSDTGILTIIAPTTFALRGWLADNDVYYVGAPNINGSGVATLSYALNDGAGFVSASATTSLVADPTNDVPVVDANGAAPGNNAEVTFQPRGNAVQIAPQLMLTDIDSTSLSSATVQLTAGARDNQFGTFYETLRLSAAGQDLLAAAHLSISSTPSASGALLTISGLADIATYQALLREVLYSDSNPNAFAGDRTVTISVTDSGGAVSNTASFATAAPNAAIAVGQRIFINGVDSGELVAQVLDSQHFVASGPLNTLADGAVLSLRDGTGQVTTAVVEGPLVATTTVHVPWTPVIDMNGGAAGRDNSVAYVEDQGRIAIAAADASITDQGGLIRSLTVELTNPLDNAHGAIHETLGVPNATVMNWLATHQITASGNGSGASGLTGATRIVFTASGAGSDATNFQVALRGVGYSNTSQDPDTTQRVVTVSSIDVDGHPGVNANTYIYPAQVNDAPEGINSVVTGSEDQPYVFGAGDFGFSDPTDAADGSADALAAVRISSLPAGGVLQYHGAAVVVGQTITVAELGAGALRYVPADNASGPAVASFGFQVQDNGGTARAGVNLDPTPATMQINLSPLNDAPVLAGHGNDLAAVSENAIGNAGQTVAALLGSISDVDTGVHSAANGVRTGMAVHAVASGGVNGSWQFSIDDGTSWQPVTLGASQALLLSGSDRVRFVPDAVGGTSAGNLTQPSLSYYAWDQSAGSHGDVVSTVVRGGASALSVAGDTISIAIVDANDAPTITAPLAQTVAEDGSLSITGLAIDDIDISLRADGDAGNDMVTVSLAVGHGSINLVAGAGIVISAGANGSAAMTLQGSLAAVNAALAALDYHPQADFNGTDALSITVDDGGNVGAGGALQASTSVTIHVTPVNDAPVLTAAAPDMGVIGENDTATAGTLVSDLVTGEGQTGVLDIDTGAGTEAVGQGIAIYALGNAGPGGGTWQYSVAGSAIWTDIGTVDQAHALLLGSSDKLRFVPDSANAAVATVSYYLWDGASGSAGDKVDVGAGHRGGSSAFSLAGDTASIRVTAVNDAPTIDLDHVVEPVFSPRGDAVALFDGHLVLADVDAGDILTSARVVLDPDYTLDNAFGTIYETLSSTLAGGVYAGTLGDILVSGNGTADDPLVLSGNGTVADYQAALQTLVYSNANPNAYAGVRPVLLTVYDAATTTAGAGAGASATATLQLQVNWGAVADLNGDDDDGRNFETTYVEKSGSVAVAAADASLTDQDGNIASVTVRLTNPIDGAAEELFVNPSQITAFAAIGITVSGNHSHQITLTGSQDGTYFQLALRAIQYANNSAAPSGADRIVTVSSVDVDGNAGVGAQTTIHIAAVNDAPAGIDGAASLTEDQAHALSLADFHYSDSEGNALLSVVIATLPGTGMLELDGVAVSAGQEVSAADIAAGKLVYTPAANANGVLNPAPTLTFRVRDAGGTALGGADLDASANTLTLNIAPVNDAPTAADGSGLPGATVSGALRQGAVLNANLDIADLDLNGAGILAATSYQWQSRSVPDGVWTDIAGATGSSHVLSGAEVNREVRVLASYTDGDTPPTVYTLNSDDPARPAIVGDVDGNIELSLDTDLPVLIVDPEGDVTVDNDGTGPLTVSGMPDEGTLTVGGAGPTTLADPRGDINIHNAGPGTVTVTGLDDDATVTTSGDGPVTLADPEGDVNLVNHGPGSVTVEGPEDDATVNVGGAGPTTLANPDGDINIHNAGPGTATVTGLDDDATVTASGNGPVTVADPEGDVNLVNHGPGSVTVQGPDDDATVNVGGAGPTTVADPRGDISIHNAGPGTVTVSGLDDDATVTTSGNGPVTLADPEGDVNLINHSPGSVTVEGANDDATVNVGGAGPTTVADPDGDIRIHNAGPGTVTVSGLNDDATVTTSGNGPVTVADPEGDVNLVNQGPGSVTVQAANDDATVRVSGAGPTTVADPDGDISIHNDGPGTVTVTGLNDDATATFTGDGPSVVDLAGLPVDGHIHLDNRGGGTLNVLHAPPGATVDASGAGDVSVRAPGGDLHIHNDGTGTVHVDQIVDGATVTKTGSGPAAIEHPVGDLTVVNDDSGLLSVQHMTAGSTLVAAGSGPIQVESHLAQGEHIHVDASANSNIQFANTGAGTIDVSGDLRLDAGDPVTVNVSGDGATAMTVAGTVSLDGTPLHLQLDDAYRPHLGDSITLLDNDGSDAITGNFAGLPEGAPVYVGGQLFHISYVGGSGNDVVLTRANDGPTGVVTIGGSPTQKEVLVASNTLADTDGMGTVSYRWLIDGAIIATGSSYVLTQADVGKAITVVASYTDAQGTSESVESAPTGRIANANDVPTGSVLIAGDATLGQTLLATNHLSDIDGMGAVSYQWQANGVNIAGANAENYLLKAGDIGKAISVVASYTDGYNTVERVASAATEAVKDGNGVSPVTESLAPALNNSGAAGDGNGDGVADALQSSVASVALSRSDTGGASFMTLVTDSVNGKAGSDATAALTDVKSIAKPADLPSWAQSATDGISFTSHTEAPSGVQNFSLYVDASLGINGYWAKNAEGMLVNLASAAYGGQTVVEGDKIRLDFHIADGGEFDASGAGDSTIVASGVAAHASLSIIGYAIDNPAAANQGNIWD